MNEIFYIQTYDPESNIGRAYNRHISFLPDDCWVCITDHDTNFLIPKFGHQLLEIVEKHGKEYALLGCVTNRLGGLHQLHNNQFSNDMDMKNHYTIALERRSEFNTEVKETSGIAGVLMLFKKATWGAVGGFEENNIACDTAFNKAIKAKGIGKIGLMTGVYIFHCYRIWQSDHQAARWSVAHLR